MPPWPEVKPVTMDKLPKQIIFHDGRLVQTPTPLIALLTILWIPIGFLLACLRIAASALLPKPLVYYALMALGIRVTIKGTPPPQAKKSRGQFGVLFVCSHRTRLDPIFLSIALGHAIQGRSQGTDLRGAKLNVKFIKFHHIYWHVILYL